MKIFLNMILVFQIMNSVWASEEQYLVGKGDSLLGILRSLQYGQNYAELLPYIQKTLRLNPTVFINNNPDFIVPGNLLQLPEHPDKPEPVVTPVVVQVPEPVVEPEPEPEPEPEEQPIGRILSIKGQSEILRDEERILVISQDTLHEEDTILTNDNTQARIILQDETEMTLGPNTRIIINEFSFQQEFQNKDHSQDSLITTLQKGVLRIVSGLISRLNENQYQFKSAFTSTIGVRGTDFTVRACTEHENCGDLFGVSAAVSSGGIKLQNQTSEINLDQNEFAQVISASEAPKKAPLPEGFFDLDKNVAELEVASSWLDRVLIWIKQVF